MRTIYIIFAATQLAIFYYQQHPLHLALRLLVLLLRFMLLVRRGPNRPQPTIRIYTVSRRLHHHQHSQTELHRYARLHYNALLRHDSLLTEHHPPYRRIDIRYS